MRRRHFTHGAAAVFLLCAAVILISAGLYAALRQRPSSDPSALAAGEPLPDSNMPDFNVGTSSIPPDAPYNESDLPLMHDETADPDYPADSERHDFTAPSETKEPSESQNQLIEETPEVMITSLPSRMRIPALSLDYEIQVTGADASGTMQIYPALEVISWFDRSSIPGNKGNAILGGHNAWKGVRSHIYKLDSLEIGDELEIVYADGSSLLFKLESVFVYPLATAPAYQIMDVHGVARLTLITCKAPFNHVTGTSDNRIVATFKEESVFVIPDPPIRPFPPKVALDPLKVPPAWMRPVTSDT